MEKMSGKKREADCLEARKRGKLVVVVEEEVAEFHTMSLSFPFFLDSRKMSIKAMSSLLAVEASS